MDSDYIANPVGTGPLANKVRADGFTKTLTFIGDITPGKANELRIEVSDTGDGLLDTGLLVSGKLVTLTQGDFTIDRSDHPLREGETRYADFGIDLPNGAPLSGDVTVTFRPDEYVDLGAGAGVAITEKLTPDQLFGELKYTVVEDGQRGTARVDLIDIEVAGLAGAGTIAPLLIQVVDRVPTVTYTLGDAPEKLRPDEPRGWIDAWTHQGVEITHSASASAVNARWSAVSLTNLRPATLAGGDILRGDLGVSGGKTEVPQDITGKEGLRFQFKSGAVDAVDVDFARFEQGDAAQLKFYDVTGKLVASRVATTDSIDVTGLSGIQTMVVTARAGAFMLDSVEVTERTTRSQFSEVPAATFADEVGIARRPAFLQDLQVGWLPSWMVDPCLV